MAKVAPTNRPQNRKSPMMWFFPSLWFLSALWFFAELVVFLAALWFFAELVVFWRLCGFLPSLWFFGGFVDLRSTVVINGKPQRDLTTESRLCYARRSEVVMNTIKCSYFRNIQSKKASEIITLADFVERIKTRDDKVI